MFKKDIKLTWYVLIISVLNLLLYNFPFFKFVYNNIELNTFNAVLLFTSLLICAILLNAWVFYIGLHLLKTVGKWLIIFFFNISAVSLYFINTYGVFIDRTMIGNVFNTNYDEASSFFSMSLILYIVILGILPSYFIYKSKHIKVAFKPFIIKITSVLFILLTISYINSPNWLWIDKNSKQLGSLVMPWSYVVNTVRYYQKEAKKRRKQKLLPDAKIADNTKSVFVLVIGESARSENFSLYGYDKNTNPLLSQIEDLHAFKAESAATYTTAGVKAILDYTDSNDLNEILPNYLHRNGVNVTWRTTNWGEPKVNIDQYYKKKDLKNIEPTLNNEYDEVLLSGINNLITNSSKDKILIILHTSTSHGPTYYKKYPQKFNTFTPVCESVELANCTNQELINAYDNTIVYTDYILANLINRLKKLERYNSAMMFVSDHGESLGENNLYMHGVPISIAPKEQFEIPFIVWTSDKSIEFKYIESLSQHHVFHSVLDFLNIESPIYNESMSILKDN